MNEYLALDTLADVSGAPEKIAILPKGLVKSQKGSFLVDDESYKLIKNAFRERGNDIVIDYEHQTLKDIKAPAGGWIKDIFNEEGAITALVEWTPTAAEYLKNKEYRYLSPVILRRKSDRRVAALHSCALTNTPAIDKMIPIVNSYKPTIEGGDDMEFLKTLAALFGLGEDAAEEQIIDAAKTLIATAASKEVDESDDKIVANKVICELVGLKAGALTEDVAAKIITLQNTPSIETEFKALKEKLARRDADERVMTALKSGRLTHAQKEWAEEYALKDPEGFDAFIAKAPQIVPLGTMGIDPKPEKKRDFDDDEMKVLKMMGVDTEDALKYGKEDL
ncbi:phage protease [Oscillospiraceae bacterium OttesenSCG-928-F05]|nr:phage protease [Oscillospiraceae bacterium OttesenSCG-928-F05]